MHRCRVDRRKNKDAVKELDEIVKFFNEQNNKSTVNKLKQLLGRQRKTEEYLESDRVYKPRKGGMINEN
jgi:tRNA C32,U32 (ribose-2'-O)-methylase TrmJ